MNLRQSFGTLGNSTSIKLLFDGGALMSRRQSPTQPTSLYRFRGSKGDFSKTEGLCIRRLGEPRALHSEC